MNVKMKLVLGGYSICLLVYTIYLFLGTQLTVLFAAYTILLLIPAVWLAIAWNKQKQETNRLTCTIKNLEEKNREFEQRIMLLRENEKELTELISQFGVNRISYNLISKTATVSDGIDQIFGYSKQHFTDQPFKWQEMIEREDIPFSLGQEKKLLLGQSVKYEHRIKKQDGTIAWLINCEIPIYDANGELVKIERGFIDMTKQKEREQKLRQLAFYDDLTELPNRKMLNTQFRKALARSKRHHHTFIVMFIDLDGFKNVNDTFGHECGDLLLVEVANRLNESVREEDLIVRLGGDEFIIIFEETNKEEIVEIAERILTTISKSYFVNENQMNVSPSIGISMYPGDGEDQETLIQNADKAMYYAKNNGKNNYQFYSEDLDYVPPRKFEWFDKFVKGVAKIKG